MAKKKLISKPGTIQDKVSNKVRDYSNDPFVLRKGREAKEFIEKHGFPEDWKK
jgi:hypothetical protein